MARTKAPKVIKLRNVIKSSLDLLLNNKALIIQISLIYAIFYFIFVLTLSLPINAKSVKNSFLGGINHKSNITASYSTFNYLLTNNTNSNINSTGANTAYQVILLVVFSLCFIFLFRNAINKNEVSLKDVFYKSTYPLVPYLLTLIIVFLELIPFEIGVGLYSLLVAGKNTSGSIEGICLFILMVALSILSLYLISVSLLATYVVTLNDMTPIAAIKSAGEVIKGRRFVVIVGLILLPILLFIISAVVLIPLILILPGLATYAYLILAILALPIFHAYMYSLYRELIK